MELLNIPFTKLAQNDIPRPWLRVSIFNPHTGQKVKVLGLIDTGADECALPASYASMLGHNLQNGHAKEINTGNGKTIAYSHTVAIEIANFSSQETLIDFMPNLHVPLLGFKSFLANFVLEVDYPRLQFSLRSR